MSSDDHSERLSALVSEAVALIAAQADCGVIEAFDRLRTYASENHEALEHTALDVIDGVIRFDA